MYKMTSIIVTGIVSYEDTYLMIKRSQKDDTEPGTWEFPGGTVEEGEGFTDALKRELFEETHLRVVVGGISYAVGFERSSGKRSVLLCYRCTANGRDVALSPEHDDHLWANKETMLSVLNPEIVEDLRTQNVLGRL